MWPLLGESLLAGGLINRKQLDRALGIQQRSGGRLGDILIGEGMVGYHALYQTIAHHHQLPYADLITNPPDKDLLTRNPESYLKRCAIPWKQTDNGLCVAVASLSAETLEWVEASYGKDVELAVTSPFDIRRAVEYHFGALLENRSRLGLWHYKPQHSARTILHWAQKYLLLALGAILLTSMIAIPVQSALGMIIFCHLTYGATLLFKCIVFAAGTKPLADDAPTPDVDEHSLPVYTVLIPMYMERESLPGMLEAMQRMDYPQSKLDIKLVLESDDRETLEAAYALKPRYHFDIIRVPPAKLRTKPRACNYALRFARGTYVTIFDADDRPERSQLKKAVQAFRSSPPDVACLQARLNYYNANDNWLTRFFSLEYTILFHFMLYGLQRLGIPIPLGGTSNHIVLDKLRELGEWDPYNVTEDADLGTRMAAQGYRTVMLDSYTMEEAPNRVMPWIRQRSRWIKGYMQTWLVHMRRPGELFSKLGWKGFTGFQFFIGLSCFTFLTAPLVWLLSLLWVGSMAAWHNIAFPDWLAWLTVINLSLNFLTHWYFAAYCAFLYRRHIAAMAWSAMIYPFYLVLHTVASYRAIWQIIVKPHFWDKTMHGLSRHMDLHSLEQDIVALRHKSR